MEHLRKYEGFLDLFKSGLNMISERISTFLKGKKMIKLSISTEESKTWTWIEEIVDLGEFDFKLNLIKDGEAYTFRLECQSKTDGSLKSTVVSGAWIYGKLSNFEKLLFDTLESIILEARVLVSAEKSNSRFVEDFPIEEVEDYLIDLKDLFHDEVEIKFEKAGKCYGNHYKEKNIRFIEVPSYVVIIKTLLDPEKIEALKSELEVIDSNIRNMGLGIKGDFNKKLQLYDKHFGKFGNFRFELIRIER